MADDSKLMAEWFWTDRWMGSSAFLLPIEPRGLYREMLTQAWRRGAALPADHEAVRRAVGCTMGEWKRCWPLISKYWRVEGDAMFNDTQRDVFAETQAVRMRASERGRKGAQARAQALTQAQLKVPLKVEPPSPSPSPFVPSEQKNTYVRVQKSEDDDNALAIRAGEFARETYPRLYEQFRKGAKYVPKSENFDFLEAMQLVKTWDDARLEKIAQVFLTTDHQFAESGSRTMAQFRSLASWCDGKLCEANL